MITPTLPLQAAGSRAVLSLVLRRSLAVNERTSDCLAARTTARSQSWSPAGEASVPS